MIKDAINNFLSFIVGLLIGVIGIMFAINTYVFDLQNKQLELDRLLHDVEKSSDYGARFKDLNKRVSGLEVSLASLQSIEPYYTESIRLPQELSDKRALLDRIMNDPSSFSRQQLVNMIGQSEDETISKVAGKAFLSTIQDQEINIATKLAIYPFRGSIVEYQRDLAKYLSKDNIKLFEKAWLMHAVSNEQLASYMLDEVIKLDLLQHEALLRMYKFSKNQNFKYSVNILEPMLLVSQKK